MNATPNVQAFPYHAGLSTSNTDTDKLRKLNGYRVRDALFDKLMVRYSKYGRGRDNVCPDFGRGGKNQQLYVTMQSRVWD